MQIQHLFIEPKFYKSLYAFLENPKAANINCILKFSGIVFSGFILFGRA